MARLKQLSGFKEKYQNMNIAVKVAFWYTFCNVLQRGVSVITVPIFTRVMTTEQYGTYSMYLSWLNILSIFTSLNLYYGVLNKAMVKYEDDRDRYISSMQGVTITMTTIYFVVYLLFSEQLNDFFGLSTAIVIMMFIEMLVTPALQFWSARQRFEYKYKGLVAISVIKTILNPAVGIVAVLMSEQKTEARIFSIVLVEVVICGTIMIQQFVKGKAFFVKEYWKYSILFNIPLIPHYLSGTILNQGDKIVIQKLESATSVALYSVAYNVGMLTQLVTNAISQAMTPWLYGCLKEKRYGGINKRINEILVVVAAGCVLMMLFAPEIVWIFASKEYYSAVYVIPPVAASVFFIFVYNVYSNFEFYYEKRLFITIASVASAALNIGLNFLFVPIFGYVAAGYTTLACYMAYAFAHYFFSSRICRTVLDGEKIFRANVLLLLSIVLVICCVLISLVYSSIAIRYGIIALILVICIIKRKDIINIVTTIKKE